MPTHRPDAPRAGHETRHGLLVPWRTGARRAVGLGSLLAVVTCSGEASALYEDDDGALTLDANFRNMTALVLPRASLGPSGRDSAGLNASALRLTADGAPAAWFSYELHAVQDMSMVTAPEALEGLSFAAPETQRYRLAELSSTWIADPNVRARLWIDRASVKYRLGRADIELGRQAITFGKAHFWNPLDVFLPFDARQFDREYKLGVDALRVDVPIGLTSGLNLIAAPGRVDGARVTARSWYGSAALVHAFTNVADYDLALQAGKIYGGTQFGGGVAGQIGPIDVRGEATYVRTLHERADRVPLPNHWVAVAGLGLTFDSSLTLDAEYLYNGAGDDDSLTAALARVSAGRSLQMSEHVAGALVSYDLLPILTGSAATLVSLSDGSFVVQPGLTYSVSDESDLLAGALVAFGKRPRSGAGLVPELRSEFGTYPNVGYAQYRCYF
ncbi:MAG: hypothetical protein JW940_19875 [Polyangiaceae bacterium]|nr:hypothetical protein [Polyangiaceae bacterium]